MKPAKHSRPAQMVAEAAPAWRRILAERLPLYGHRNWILVADSAYPSQCAPGVETVPTEAGHLDVLKAVLLEIEKAAHVRPTILLDSELDALQEKDAPGIECLRQQLANALGKLGASRIPHEEAIARLDKAAALFNVLVLKTKLALPYTTVFIQLDCGYWNDASKN